MINMLLNEFQGIVSANEMCFTHDLTSYDTVIRGCLNEYSRNPHEKHEGYVEIAWGFHKDLLGIASSDLVSMFTKLFPIIADHEYAL